jgi:hypothetical protein
VRTVGYAQIEFELRSHVENALCSSDVSIGNPYIVRSSPFEVELEMKPDGQ